MTTNEIRTAEANEYRILINKYLEAGYFFLAEYYEALYEALLKEIDL